MDATAVTEPEKGDNDEPPLPSHGHAAPNPSVPETILPPPMERELPHLQEQQNSLSTSTESGHQGVIATCNSIRPCTESQSQYATLGLSKSPTTELAIDTLQGQIPSDYIALSESTEMDSEELEAMNKVQKWRNQIVELSDSEDEDEYEQEGKKERNENETETETATVSKGLSLSGRTYIFSSDLVSVSAATETSSLQHRRQQYIAYQNQIRRNRENRGNLGQEEKKEEEEEGLQEEREARKNHKRIKNWIIDHKSSFMERIKQGFSFGENRKRKRKADSGADGVGAGGVGINRELTPLRNWDPMLGTKRLPPKPELSEEEKEERQINKMRRSGNYLQ